MVNAKLRKTEYSWEMESKCPRCKHTNKEYWYTERRLMTENKETKCYKCQLLYKETVNYVGAYTY